MYNRRSKKRLQTVINGVLLSSLVFGNFSSNLSIAFAHDGHENTTEVSAPAHTEETALDQDHKETSVASSIATNWSSSDDSDHGTSDKGTDSKKTDDTGVKNNDKKVADSEYREVSTGDIESHSRSDKDEEKNSNSHKDSDKQAGDVGYTHSDVSSDNKNKDDSEKIEKNDDADTHKDTRYDVDFGHKNTNNHDDKGDKKDDKGDEVKHDEKGDADTNGDVHSNCHRGHFGSSNGGGEDKDDADCADHTVVVNTIPDAPLPAACVSPDAQGNSTSVALGASVPVSELSLQVILANAGITVGTSVDQKNYQVWSLAQAQTTVTIENTFLDKIAGNSNTFGYYVNGDLSTFVGLFRKGSSTMYASIPEVAAGQKMSFTTGASKIGFAIVTENASGTMKFATEKALNADGGVHALVYDLGNQDYAIGFEDLPLNVSDKDYNDMVVKVHVAGCTKDVPPPAPVPAPNPTPAPNPAPAPDLGSIRICKMIVDEHNNAVTNSTGLPAGKFSIDLATTTAFGPSVVGTAHFDAATFSPTVNYTGVNDSQCQTFAEPIGEYYYSQEAVSGAAATSTWSTALYNDQDLQSINNTSDFFPYSGELFTDTTSDDINRNTNADGHIVLSSGRKDRTLVVLNKFVPVVVPPCTTACNGGGGGLNDLLLSLIGDATVNVTIGNSYIDAGATTTDHNGVAVNVASTTDVNTSVVGTYHVTYSATDTLGVVSNPPTVTRTVNVVPVAVTGCTANCGGGGSGGGTPACTSNCGGGGGGPIAESLVITNEAVTRTSPTEALVTWTTNIPSSSQVVYDTASHVAVLVPNYGYPVATASSTDLVTTHSMTVSGLSLGATIYYFRPVSFKDPLHAVGIELVLRPGFVEGASTSNPNGPITPTVCGNFLRDFIHVGWKNDPEQVRILQLFLRDFQGESIAVNGFYDKPTWDAVNRFQEKYGITDDFNSPVLKTWSLESHTGFVYITTRNEINEIFCHHAIAFTPAQLREIADYRAYIAIHGQPAPATYSYSPVVSSTTPTNHPTGAAGNPVSEKPVVGSGAHLPTTTPVTATTTGTSTTGAVGTSTGTGMLDSLGNTMKSGSGVVSGLAGKIMGLPDRLSNFPWLPIVILILIAVLAIYLLRRGSMADDGIDVRQPIPSTSRAVAPVVPVATNNSQKPIPMPAASVTHKQDAQKDMPKQAPKHEAPKTSTQAQSVTSNTTPKQGDDTWNSFFAPNSKLADNKNNQK